MLYPIVGHPRMRLPGPAARLGPPGRAGAESIPLEISQRSLVFRPRGDEFRFRAGTPQVGMRVLR